VNAAIYDLIIFANKQCVLAPEKEASCLRATVVNASGKCFLGKENKSNKVDTIASIF